MNLRDPDTISDQIAQLQLDLQELKARQFTGQDSGMLFRRTVGPTATISAIADQYECFYINTTFAPSLGKTTINYPTFTLSVDEYADTIHIVPTEEASYIYNVYASGWGSGWYNWTIYVFFHQIANSNGSITWQSLIYNDGASGNATFRFTPIVNASDSGTITSTVGKYY